MGTIRDNEIVDTRYFLNAMINRNIDYFFDDETGIGLKAISVRLKPNNEIHYPALEIINYRKNSHYTEAFEEAGD